MVKNLMELGTTEAAVEHGDFREVFGQGRPTADGGTAGEEG